MDILFLFQAFISICLSFLTENVLSVPFSKEIVDPEVDMNASQIIKYHGYPCEEYDVLTPDGYILTIQRIPHSKTESKHTPRSVVFLQHGLLCSSTNWITNLVNESFAFILADAGYDVYLGNVRGNTYGLQNNHTDPSQDDFWAFSFDEMARYDLPSMIKFALKTSNQSQLYYAGHSQGTMIAFAEFSRNKELASKVKTFFALAPVTTVGAITSPLRYLTYFLPEIKYLFKVFGVKDFLPSTLLMKWLAEDVCENGSSLLCANVLFIIAGFDTVNLNQSRLPVYLSHTPSGTSVQNMVHFAQMIESKKFQMYDYGSSADNLKHYRQDVPPLYFPENMTVPTFIFSGGQDLLADPVDVQGLIPKIQNLVGNVNISEYDHLDFIWGINAAQRVYQPIINMIQKNEILLKLNGDR